MRFFYFFVTVKAWSDGYNDYDDYENDYETNGYDSGYGKNSYGQNSYGQSDYSQNGRNQYSLRSRNNESDILSGMSVRPLSSAKIHITKMDTHQKITAALPISHLAEIQLYCSSVFCVIMIRKLGQMIRFSEIEKKFFGRLFLT